MHQRATKHENLTEKESCPDLQKRQLFYEKNVQLLLHHSSFFHFSWDVVFSEWCLHIFQEISLILAIYVPMEDGGYFRNK